MSSGYAECRCCADVFVAGDVETETHCAECIAHGCPDDGEGGWGPCLYDRRESCGAPVNECHRCEHRVGCWGVD